jgi:hypothetical protein
MKEEYGSVNLRESAAKVYAAAIADATPQRMLAPELIGLQLGAGVGAFQRSLLDALADGTLSDEERDEADKALVRLSLQISNARRTIRGAK